MVACCRCCVALVCSRRNSLWQNTIAFDRSGNQNHGVLHSCGSPVSDRMVVDPAADVPLTDRVRGGHFRKPVWQLIPEEKFNAGNCGSLVTLDGACVPACVRVCVRVSVRAFLRACCALCSFVRCCVLRVVMLAGLHSSCTVA